MAFNKTLLFAFIYLYLSVANADTSASVHWFQNYDCQNQLGGTSPTGFAKGKCYKTQGSSSFKLTATPVQKDCYPTCCLFNSEDCSGSCQSIGVSGFPHTRASCTNANGGWKHSVKCWSC